MPQGEEIASDRTNLCVQGHDTYKVGPENHNFCCHDMSAQDPWQWHWHSLTTNVLLQPNTIRNRVGCTDT